VHSVGRGYGTPPGVLILDDDLRAIHAAWSTLLGAVQVLDPLHIDTVLSMREQHLYLIGRSNRAILRLRQVDSPAPSAAPYETQDDD